jgi:hypothetical protein
MNRVTDVVIPNRLNYKIDEFIRWCTENVSPYSTEITWVYRPYETNVSTGIFTFHNPQDAVMFKLVLGL